MSGLSLETRRAAANEPDHRQTSSSGTGFPDYSRQDEAQVCLYDYGMENASLIDCVARDKNYGSALAKIWSDIDDHFKRDCVARRADRRLKSYLYFDRCIRSLQKEAEGPE